MIKSDSMTIKQAADALGESRSATSRRVRNGELPATKLDGDLGAYLIKREDVETLKGKLVEALEEKLQSMKAVTA